MTLKTVSFWYDKPLTELTREELIEAVEELGRMLWKQQEDARSDLDFLTMAMRARR